MISYSRRATLRKIALVILRYATDDCALFCGVLVGSRQLLPSFSLRGSGSRLLGAVGYPNMGYPIRERII